jgi:FKBP-type peptidyl-prolyl cis-trans isomerase FkpA
MKKQHLSLCAVLMATALTACAAGNAADKSAAPAAKDQGKSQAAQTLPSGLVYQSLKDGTGASPKATDTVRVHYHGTLADGKVFDSSVQRGQPAEFPLNRVIPCWTEGVAMMKVGGKAKLTCPPQIAYGARGAGGVIPPNATLTFEVELLAIK